MYVINLYILERPLSIEHWQLDLPRSSGRLPFFPLYYSIIFAA